MECLELVGHMDLMELLEFMDLDMDHVDTLGINDTF
jgi:hypothetical protein